MSLEYEGGGAAKEVMFSKKSKAIIFINIYCIFDTIDNINAKTAMENNVDVLDLALSRITFNFISACIFVYFSGEHVLKAVPSKHYFALSYRSLMMVIGQTCNIFAISLLPLSMVTIV